MESKLPKSTVLGEYEILIRKRGDGKYAAYCPQLNYMLKGDEHEEVYGKLRDYIENYINTLEPLESVNSTVVDKDEMAYEDLINGEEPGLSSELEDDED